VPATQAAAGAASTPLSRENARRLQAVLYELHECRRILDAVLAAGRKV
ncbi:MAG: hypothetical protein HC834_08790, partial [Rhodospirillales bacterium]|nr:hypothetical protein [Rhodospirillales bacterium]